MPAAESTGKIIVDTTTVHPETTKAVAADLHKAGAVFVASEYRSIARSTYLSVSRGRSY